jgi:transcription-repair coupling factor (superfamily II helicase)
MALEILTDLIRRSTTELVEGLKSGQDLPALGLRRSARLPVLAAVYQELQRPVLLLTDRSDRSLSLTEELALWAVDANLLLFPEPTPLFYENAAWGEGTRRDRLLALTSLAAYHIPGAIQPVRAPLLIAPARALMTRTIPRREFLKASRTLRRGQSVSIDELVRGWLGLGYELVTMVISPGQFARRGGILDLWPTADPYPTRIEFFGDEVETFRRFDPATQITFKHKNLERQELANPDRILITPAREYLASRWGGDPESPEAGDLSEFHIPLLHEMPASLLDYLPRGTIIAFDNLQAFQDLVVEVEEQAVAMRRDYIADGTLVEDFPVPYLSWSELQDALHAHYLLELGYTTRPETEPDQHPVHQIAERFAPGPRFGGRLKTLMEYMGERYLAGERQLVVSRQSARLKELWSEMSLPTDPANPLPEFLEDSLSEGWSFSPELGRIVHLLTDGEIFGWRRPEARRRHRPVAEAPEAAYADLETGDWVVHVDHGIGRFAGLVRRTVEGVEREYLCIEYADQAQLFVPIHQVDRLTRYVGPDNRMPTLSRLGGGEWRSTKAQVKDAVEEVAEDLLELYAKRSVVSGHAFSPDTPWQKELEASFPYIETDDQMKVLAEVKLDMETPRPMDRLICGDVGYGKTEVALRAAFKAVMDGRQVAVLVPTTVLAQQHFNTFQQRLAAFPVRVEMLSRFRTPQQQKRIVQLLSQGAIDILIGTHRLFSSDVDFKDLGLLIIDEEQRFGVTHKEALKQLRTEVDVLTLTATPIPRTLYMALSGVRDISTINTPPEERLPIVTHVGPYSPRLVRQAILRELERGGQVFFVHNRVQTIGAMRNHLEKLIPEARIAIAHGQMPENVLSERMEQFTAGEVEVLLSTSIIESGLDIPNANTLIVDRADTFGLAQLYQLRGRVGRGASRAYAYFFRHNKKVPTYEGRQRLETIAENTQLGAGFSIAMRDLEIRGTGDILGTRQHGHIASVGFHLYTRILAAAVRRLRNDRQLPESDLEIQLMGQLINVNVDLPQPVSIPANYVADKDVRLGLYRRMADIGTREEVDALAEEFNDRFGPPPEAVHYLLYQLKVKLLAEQAGLSSVTAEAGQLVLRFPAGEPPADLPDLGPNVRLGKVALWIPLAPLEDWPSELTSVLEKLAGYRQNINHETLPAGYSGF